MRTFAFDIKANKKFSTEENISMNRYRFYRNTWIFLEENKEQHLSKEDAKILLERKGLMIRNTYDFDTKEKTSFWYLVTT